MLYYTATKSYCHFLMRFYLFFIIACCLSLSSKPILAEEKLVDSGPQLIHLNNIDNLGEVGEMTQDWQGFLYFASDNGLVRFDGYQSKVFQSKDQTDFNYLGISDKNDLWLAGAKGLSKFDIKRQTFSFYPQTGINHLTVNNQHVWLATEQGIKYFDHQSQSIKSLETIQKPTKNNSGAAYTVTVTNNKQLWYSIRGQGVIKRDLNTNNEQVFNSQTIKDDNFSNLVNVVAATNNGDIWLGSDIGLHRYLADSNNFEFYSLPINTTNVKSQFTITDIYADKDNNIWVSSLHNGISVKFANQTEFSAIGAHNLTDNSPNPLFILRTFQDSSNTLWFVSAETGLWQLKQQALAFSNFSSNKALPVNIRAMHTDLTGEHWVGSDQALYRYDLTTNSFTMVKPQIGYIAAISSLDQSTLLLAVAGKGLYHYHKTTQSLISAFEPLNQYIVDSNFHSLALEESRLWVGLYYDQTPATGLIEYNLDNGQINAHLDQYTIESILILKPYVIAATRRSGLHLFDKITKQWQAIKHPEIDISQLWAVYQSQDGNIWLGTNNAGLIKLNINTNGTIEMTAAKNNQQLASQTIRAISEDDAGNLWLGTTNGLSSYHGATGKVHNFTTKQGNKLHSIYPEMAATLGNGRMMMSNRNQITQFNPAQLLTPQSRKVELMLSDFRLFNQPQRLQHSDENSALTTPINQTKHLTLNHQQHWFSFSFSSSLFDNHKNNRFSYHMKGLSDKWITTDHHNRTVSFTSLAPGDYQFSVKASLPDGSWDSNIRTIDITITPPWWQTPMAYLAYIFFFVTGVYSFYTLRTQALVKRANRLERQVSERTETINQLLTQKERMFANISHEFKTPLTLILSPLETINDSLSKAQLNKKLAMIKRNGQRLLRMVEQLLELSRLDSLESSPKAQYDIKKATTSLLTAFEPLITDKNLTLTREPIEQVWGEFSFDALEIILTNLISNAIKYTPAGGSINISVTGDGKATTIIVSDSGRGISDDNQALVFNRFTRANDQHDEAIPGAGIGLALVKELVESNQGTICLQSELNQGSTFTATFPQCDPLRENALPERQIDGLITANQQQLDASLIDNPPANRLTSQSVTDSELAFDNSKPMVLLVDDSHDMLTLLEDTLSENYQCICAENGQIGLDKAQEIIPDLIISDVMMPVLNGYQLAHALKQDQLTCHIPVVLLTAKGDMDARLEGWKQDIDDYLAKPFHPQELHLRIQSLLSIRQILRKRFSLQQLGQTATAPSPALDSNVDNQAQIQDEETLITPVISDKDQAFIDKFKKVIKDNYQELEFNREQAASLMAISDRQLHRKLSALIEENFTEYLRSYRLNTARDMLTTGMQISLISDEVGFTSTAYFSKCFKAQFNKTPKQYQKELTTP